MVIKSIYINLPVSDVKKTRAFWTALGFSFNEQFSDERALCLVLKEELIYAMLINHELYSTFTHRPIFKGDSTQVLLAIDVGSRDRVDEIMRIALEQGAKRYLEPADEGWMYYERFEDLDGHQWEVMTMEEIEITQTS